MTFAVACRRSHSRWTQPSTAADTVIEIDTVIDTVIKADTVIKMVTKTDIETRKKRKKR